MIYINLKLLMNLWIFAGGLNAPTLSSWEFKFSKFIYKLDSKYQVPTRKHLSTKVIEGNKKGPR